MHTVSRELGLNLSIQMHSIMLCFAYEMYPLPKNIRLSIESLIFSRQSYFGKFYIIQKIQLGWRKQVRKDRSLRMIVLLSPSPPLPFPLPVFASPLLPSAPLLSSDFSAFLSFPFLSFHPLPSFLFLLHELKKLPCTCFHLSAWGLAAIEGFP